jgi:chitinase
MRYARKSPFVSTSRNHLVVAGVALAVGLATTACGDDDVVTAPSENRAPTAVIASDLLSVPAGDANSTIVSISGTDSSDPDGNSLIFSWSVPGGTFENGTSASSSSIKVSFPGTEFQRVTLFVSDGFGGTDSAELTIGLDSPKNQPPVASFTVSPPAIPIGDGNVTVFILDSSESIDPEGDLLTFNWTVPGGTFVDGTGPASDIARVTFPGTSSTTVILEVTDEAGLSDSTSIAIRLT